MKSFKLLFLVMLVFSTTVEMSSAAFASSEKISCLTEHGDKMKLWAGKNIHGKLTLKAGRTGVSEGTWQIDLGSQYGEQFYEVKTPLLDNQLGILFDKTTDLPGLRSGLAILFIQQNETSLATLYFHCIETRN